MSKIDAYMNWSGGKDSSLCLHKIIKEGKYQVKYFLTSVNKAHNRISMHGVRTELLWQQASSVGIPLKLIELPEHPDMEEYEREMKKKVNEISEEGIRHAIFGDIFLEDLRKYRENKLQQLGIQGVFPLWKQPTQKLMEEFLDLGFKAIIVCVNEKFLDKSFCGRLIDRSLMKDLPSTTDVCGENGEYHSFVFDGPIFKSPVLFEKGEIVYKEYKSPKNSQSGHYNTACTEEKNYGFYFCDLVPLNN